MEHHVTSNQERGPLDYIIWVTGVRLQETSAEKVIFLAELWTGDMDSTPLICGFGCNWKHFFLPQFRPPNY